MVGKWQLPETDRAVENRVEEDVALQSVAKHPEYIIALVVVPVERQGDIQILLVVLELAPMDEHW